MHTHDFAEILWVTGGQVNHIVNGRKKTMRTSDLVMVLPEDTHAIESLDGEPYSIVNIGFSAKAIRSLRRRYQTDAFEWFAREGPSLPKHYQLYPEQMLMIGHEFKWLSTAPRTQLALETFCLNLLRLLGPVPSPSTAALPDWLDAALRRFARFHAEPGKLNLSHFIGLCGRSPEHVSRSMREHLGTTPSEWVNRHRLMLAARLLESTTKPISEVAAEAGFETTVYFHRLFRAMFKTTPLQYRKANRIVF